MCNSCDFAGATARCLIWNSKRCVVRIATSLGIPSIRSRHLTLTVISFSPWTFLGSCWFLISLLITCLFTCSGRWQEHNMQRYSVRHLVSNEQVATVQELLDQLELSCLELVRLFLAKQSFWKIYLPGPCMKPVPKQYPLSTRNPRDFDVNTRPHVSSNRNMRCFKD